MKAHQSWWSPESPVVRLLLASGLCTDSWGTRTKPPAGRPCPGLQPACWEGDLARGLGDPLLLFPRCCWGFVLHPQGNIALQPAGPTACIPLLLFLLLPFFQQSSSIFLRMAQKENTHPWPFAMPAACMVGSGSLQRVGGILCCCSPDALGPLFCNPREH